MLLEPLGENMYIARVKIDDENRQKTRPLVSLDVFHDWVERCFPKEWENGNRTRKLWRVDTLGGDRYLLMVSETMPDKESLERYGVSGTGAIKKYDDFLDRLQERMPMRFRVTLNPVMSISDRAQGKRGKVVPHVTEEQQMNFFLQRTEKNGFHVNPEDVALVERGYGILQKGRNQEKRRPIRLSSATYEGILTITDKNLFCQTLTKGIGKKKAYGFGLMTVIPVKS